MGRRGGTMASPRDGYERDDHVGGGAMVDRDGRSSPQRSHRRRPAHDDGTMHVDRRYLDRRPRSSEEGEDPDDASSLRSSRVVVRDGSVEGAPPRTIYGLYHRETDISTSSPNRVLPDDEEEDDDEEVGRRHERPSRWKERLRRKFDVALGLESPPSSSSSSMAGTYYDSWKAQMKEVEDGRKEAMRRRMNERDDPSTAAVTLPNGKSRRALPSSPIPIRNNRRARMRAKNQTPALDGQASPSLKSTDLPKSRLDEVPFWREGGSIASLLFENRPSLPSSTGRDDRGVMGHKFLEVRSCPSYSL